jgi:hypothetical protein
MKRWFTLAITLFTILQTRAGIEIKEHGTIYVISIGINKYNNANLTTLRNCVNDAQAFSNKVAIDNKPNSVYNNYTVDTVVFHELYDDQATVEDIIRTFRSVIKRARPSDCLLFYYAGYTFDLKDSSTVIYPYNDSQVELEIEKLNDLNSLSINDLAFMLDQVQCERQMIVSEAGMGKTFADNLTTAMFESNPNKALTNHRNRVIVTTRSWGIDNHKCGDEDVNHGPLTYYLLQDKNILQAFFRPNDFRNKILELEKECPTSMGEYTLIEFEHEHVEGLLLENGMVTENDYSPEPIYDYAPNDTNNLDSVMRGGRTERRQTRESIANKPKTYGLIVATDKYNSNSGWTNLKNPITDAEKIADLLESKYEVDVIRLYNKSVDSLFIALENLTDRIREQDKLVVFIAGHGYYSERTGACGIPLIDSKPIEQDRRMTTYATMPDLKSRLDFIEAKQVFVILDICFGANFDPIADNMAPADYNNLVREISITGLEKRKSKYQARIFLASGQFEVPDYWSTSLSTSPFAAKLIKAMQEDDSFLTPGKLYNEAQANVTEPILRSFGKHEPQGDFILPVKQ